MAAVQDFAKYLLSHHRFKYFLSGKLMSDPTEGQFEWYRQINSGNFFMPVKQLVQEYAGSQQ